MQLLIVNLLFKEKKIMKTTYKFLSLSFIIVLFISSCDWYGDNHVVGSGDVETMEVSLSEFSGVSVTGTCNVDIHIGDEQKVELIAQSEILDVMTYEVKDHVLYIGFKNGTTIKNSKEISAEIVIPSVSYIAVTGAGDFMLDGSRQESLDIYITGTGDINAFDMEVKFFSSLTRMVPGDHFVPEMMFLTLGRAA